MMRAHQAPATVLKKRFSTIRIEAGCPRAARFKSFIIMSKEEIQAQLENLFEEETSLRRRLEELEEIAQSAPGSHSSGPLSPEAVLAEREIRSIVLDLVGIDRQRVELTVALSLA